MRCNIQSPTCQSCQQTASTARFIVGRKKKRRLFKVANYIPKLKRNANCVLLSDTNPPKTRQRLANGWWVTGWKGSNLMWHVLRSLGHTPTGDYWSQQVCRAREGNLFNHTTPQHHFTAFTGLQVVVPSRTKRARAGRRLASFAKIWQFWITNKRYGTGRGLLFLRADCVFLPRSLKNEQQTAQRWPWRVIFHPRRRVWKNRQTSEQNFASAEWYRFPRRNERQRSGLCGQCHLFPENENRTILKGLISFCLFRYKHCTLECWKMGRHKRALKRKPPSPS